MENFRELKHNSNKYSALRKRKGLTNKYNFLFLSGVRLLQPLAVSFGLVSNNQYLNLSHALWQPRRFDSDSIL